MIIQHINDIRDHFKEEYPREACGILFVKKGKTYWKACTNIAEDGDDFVLDPKEYVEVLKQGDILAVVHNHPDGSCQESENDVKYCNALGVNYYIFSYPGMELNILNPKVCASPLVGREYSFGRFDCLEAVRDYYSEVLSIELRKRLPYIDDWWKVSDDDYFTESHMKEWGFKKVSTLEKNDVLVFSVNANIGNHCGVYIDNDLFFHHAVNRLSCRENLYPFWKKHIIGIYRYEQ